MKVIFEIDDDLVQAQVTMLTQKEVDRAHREPLMKYFQEHESVMIPEEQLAEIDEDSSTVMAVLAIGVAAKELNIF